MASLLISRPTLVWLILVAATGLSWGVGHEFAGPEVRAASVAIIVIAFLKVRLVILEFMEIRSAPLVMRLVGEAWILVICTSLILLYLRAPRP